MVYIVTREILHKRKVIQHQNIFDDLDEAEDFYNGTNGISRVGLYKNETLLAEKGTNVKPPVVETSPEPVLENNNPVEESTIKPSTEIIETDAELTSDIVPLEEPLDVASETETTNDVSSHEVTSDIKPATEETITETAEETVVVENDNDVVVVEVREELNIDVDEYQETESETVSVESNENIQQLVFEEQLINKINTSPTYSFLNK